MEEYERHSLSTIGGDMPEAEYQEMLAHYMKKPIQLMVALLEEDGKDKILDGWHRQRMAKDAGKTCIFWHYTMDDPIGYVKQENLYRRHWNASQRAAYIVACESWATGGRPVNPLLSNELSPKTTAQMAEEANTSPQTVTDARTANRGGLGNAVLSGEMSAKAAATQVRDQEREEREEADPVFNHDGSGDPDFDDAPAQQVPNDGGEDGEVQYGDTEDAPEEPTSPRTVVIQYAEYKEHNDRMARVLARVDELEEQVALLKEANSPDPDTSKVVANQRAVINSLESSVRSLTEERNILSDQVERQRATLRKFHEQEQSA